MRVGVVGGGRMIRVYPALERLGASTVTLDRDELT
jgi:uridylate kinase